MSKRKRKAESEPPAAAAAAASAADQPNAAVSTSEYEQRRQQQIARNQALLSSLIGLTDISTSFSASSAAAAAESKRVSNAAAKAAREKRKAERAQLLSLLPRRDLPTRSSRTAVNYTEERIVDSTPAAARNHAGGEEDEEDDQLPRKNADLSDFIVPDSAGLGRISASGSTRSAQHTFTLPLRALAPYISRTIPLLFHTPKAAAMSFLFAGWPEESNKQARKPPPTFNKMSGIQKLGNHIALFINVDEEEASSSRGYDNQWQNGGRQVSWFAQPTQRVDTPVIGVIIAAVRAKKERMDNADADDEYVRSVLGAALKQQQNSSSSSAAAAASSNGKVKKEIRVKQENESLEEPPSKKSKKIASPDNAATSSSAAASNGHDDIGDASADPKSVLLFLRFAGSSYVYAGALAYHSHDTTRTPMKFVFTLAEYDKLVQHEDFLNLLPKSVRAQATGGSSKSSK